MSRPYEPWDREHLVLDTAVGYLFGAIPSGYLAGKLLRGIDIREHGSKSTLENGQRWVLIADVLKGVAAIIVVRSFCPWLYAELSPKPPTALDLQIWVPWTVCVAGIAVLLGHSRSIWLNFTGGRSAATGLDVLLAMSWPVGLGAAAVFGIVLAIARIVSLSSILAALTAVVLVCAFEQPLPYRLLVIGGGIYVIGRHRANIQRLWLRTEPRFGQTGPDTKSEAQV